jgi:hypothetical protein
MAMTYPMGTLYVNGTKVAEVTNLEVVSTRQAAKPPLSKPSRVEKWQRWRNEMGEVLVMAIEPSHIKGLDDFARLANGYGTRPTSELLNWPEWTFLGYAKPEILPQVAIQ